MVRVWLYDFLSMASPSSAQRSRPGLAWLPALVLYGFWALAGLPRAVLAQADTPATTLPTPSAHYDVVRQRLDVGGQFLVYLDIDGDVEKIGRDLTAMMHKIAGEGPDGALLRQDYTALLAELGLTQIKAIGMSSVAREQDSFQNRAFLYIPEPRRGLLAAFGGPARPFTTARYAPPESDIFIESEMDIPTLVVTLTNVFGRFIPPEMQQTATALMQQEWDLDSSGIVDFLQALKGRFTLAVKFGTPPPEASPAGPQALQSLLEGTGLFLRVEGIGQKLIPLLVKSEAFTQTTGENRHVFALKEKVPQLGSNQPLVVIEGPVAYVASSRAFFDESLQRTQSLESAPAFQRALALTATEGNTVSYVSPRCFALLRTGLEWAAFLSAQELGHEAAGNASLQALLSTLPVPKEAMVTVMANTSDGILWHAVQPVSYKSSLLALGMYNPETLGTLVRMVAPWAASAYVDQQREARLSSLVEANLALLTTALDRYFAANPNATSVEVRALRKSDPQLATLKSVADEDYNALVITRGFGSLSVAMSESKTVVYDAPLTEAHRTAIRANLKRFDPVLTWYFTTHPKDLTMPGTEAIGRGSPMRVFPSPIRGEDYRSLLIDRNATAITIFVVGEEIAIPREMPRPSAPRPPGKPPRR